MYSEVDADHGSRMKLRNVKAGLVSAISIGSALRPAASNVKSGLALSR
jgi:hypothetical protein